MEEKYPYIMLGDEYFCMKGTWQASRSWLEIMGADIPCQLTIVKTQRWPTWLTIWENMLSCRKMLASPLNFDVFLIHIWWNTFLHKLAKKVTFSKEFLRHQKWKQILFGSMCYQCKYQYVLIQSRNIHTNWNSSS